MVVLVSPPFPPTNYFQPHSCERIGKKTKEEQLLFCPSNCVRCYRPVILTDALASRLFMKGFIFIGAQLEHLPTAYKAPRAAAHSGQYGFCSLSSSTPPRPLSSSFNYLAHNLHSKMVSFNREQSSTRYFPYCQKSVGSFYF
jgi:hypothetical protein